MIRKLRLNENEHNVRQKIEYLELSDYNSTSKSYRYNYVTYDYSNFTIRDGDFIGVAVIGGEVYKVYWSGWISGGKIMLYFVDNIPYGWERRQWVNEEDFINMSKPDLNIITNRNFEEEWYERLDDCLERGIHECNAGRESDYVPFFAE